MKVQAGRERELTPSERNEIRRYSDAPPLDDESASDDDDNDDAVKMHIQYQKSKEAQKAQGSSRYRPTKRIACTTNIVERLFSRANKHDS